MPQDEPHASPADDREARLRRAVADYVREVVLGREVTPEAWAEDHPDLLPELTAELKKAQLIGIAYQRALSSATPTVVDPDEQPTLSFWRTDVSTLHVRCPHCHNPVDISCDASLLDIVCTTCGSSFSLLCDTQATPTLKRIGHFELVERLGIGGFGTVWKARDTELDRTVAIKIPRAGRLGSPDIEVSFFREARAAAQLKHPGIVSVHEVGRQDDTIYIVSDLVRGVSLSEWLTAAKPTAREAAELCAKIADALHHAHEAGVVHRDLKPSNIMIDLDGEPHIMDFGLARRDAGEVTVTIDGQMLGTPAYMSPEHARGEAHQADRRSDVYSLGVILFQLLTGELPFRGHARMLMLQILRDEPPKPRTLRAGIPRDLQTICLKCLEKEPSRRYQTAAELADDLRRHLRGEPILARPISRAGRFYRWCRRQPAIAALSAILLIALAAGIVGTSWYAAIRGAEGRANLYHRLLRQVQVARLQNTEGSLERAWQELKAARWTDTPDADLDVLRQEAVLYLGDFRRYEPVVVRSATHSISAGALDSQGALMAIGHADGRIELYDPATGDAKARIPAAGQGVAALSFDDEQYRLLAVESDGRVFEVTLRDLNSGQSEAKRRHLFQVPAGHVTYQFGPHAQTLVAHRPSQVEVWSVAEQKVLRTFTPGENQAILSARLSPDGQYLAAAYRPQTGPARLILWNLATGAKETKDLDRGQGTAQSLAISHDSALVAYGGEGLALLPLPTLSTFHSSPGDQIRAVAFSPDDRWLAAVEIRGTITLWSLTVPQKVETLAHPRAPGAPASGESVMFSGDGRFLLSVKADSVRVWDLHRATERVVVSGHHGGVPSLAFSPDGSLLASAGKDQTVRIWRAVDGTPIRAPLTLDGAVQSVAFSSNGKWLVTGDWSSGDSPAQTLNAWRTSDFARQPLKHQFGDQVENDVHGVAFSRDGKYLAVSGSGGMSLWRVEAENSSEDRQLDVKHVAYRSGELSLFVQFSPDSSWLAWADNRTDVRLWDVVGQREVTIDATLYQGWHGLVFLSNDELAFVGPRAAVEVWNVRRNRKAYSLGEAGEFYSPHLAVTSDGAFLAGVHKPETVALWDVQARKKLFNLRPERSAVWSLAFNPQGTRLAVGLSDGGIALWDLAQMNRMLTDLDLAWMGDDAKD